jgi:hypothetical protein
MNRMKEKSKGKHLFRREGERESQHKFCEGLDWNGGGGGALVPDREESVFLAFVWERERDDRK